MQDDTDGAFRPLSDNRAPARPRVVYLGGFGRSGSTLLERMLGACPGWTNVGELVDLPRSVQPDDERCGCGEPFSACPFWQSVGARSFGGWEPAAMQRLAALRGQVARQRLVPALLALAKGRGARRQRSLVEEYQSAYGAIYRAAAAESGATTVVDASKGPAHGLALGLRLATDPGYDLTMVNLVRDPRGVAWSWSRRKHERPQAGGRAEMWSIGVGRSAAQWAALQAEMDVIGRMSGIPVVRVRYEDLVAHPREALADLLSRLGVADTDEALTHVDDHAVTLAASHGLSGNPSRFQHGTLDLVTDDEWRRSMPPGERRMITTATWPWLRSYGYPVLQHPDPTITRRTA